MSTGVNGFSSAVEILTENLIFQPIFIPSELSRVKLYGSVLSGSEWGGPHVGCRLKFSNFVGSRLKFSIFVGSQLDFSIFVGCRKISVNK